MNEVGANSVNSNLSVTSRESSTAAEPKSLKEKALSSGHEFIRTIKSELKNTTNKISNFLYYAPTGKSITSMASAVVYSRSSFEKINQDENLSQVGKAWAKFKSGVVTKLIHVPVATVHEIAAKVLKCIQRTGSRLALAAELGKITVLTDINKIKNNPQYSCIKKIALIALKYFTETVKLAGRSTLILASSVLELTSAVLAGTAKGVSLLLLNTHNAAGDISKPMSKQANALSQKAIQFFDRMHRRMEGLSDNLSVSKTVVDAAKQENAIAKAQADLDQAKKEGIQLKDLKKQLEQIQNKFQTGSYHVIDSKNRLAAQNEVRGIIDKAVEKERNIYNAHRRLVDAQLRDQIDIASNSKLSDSAKKREEQRIDNLKEMKLKGVREEVHDFIKNVKNLKEEYLGKIQ